jgi:hypothetical protein
MSTSIEEVHVKRLLSVAILVAVLSSAHDASATIVYSQPSVWAGNGTSTGNSLTSQTDPTLSGFRTNDNFSLATTALIDQVTWRGLYVNDVTLTDASPNTIDWSIRFQADNAGAPGAVLATFVVPDAAVTRTTLGTGTFNNGTVTVYEFTANLSGFLADAGTTYWFSPLSRAATFSPFFTWIRGTGGDNSSFETQFLNGAVTGTFVQPGDRAFSLASVPEPPTWLLLGGAVVALARVRRVKRGV